MVIEVGLRGWNGGAGTTGSTPRLDLDMLEDLSRTLRERRRREGIGEADGRWFADAAISWLGYLDRGESPPDADAIASLCVGMHETMAMRDAALLSILSPIPQDALTNLAARPHSAPSRELVRNTLTHGFEDADAVPDAVRCQRGVDVLSSMVRAVPSPYDVQPLAMLSYLLWWVGRDDQAMVCALQTLCRDPECTMPALVLNAIRHGVRPAWAERSGRRERE